MPADLTLGNYEIDESNGDLVIRDNENYSNVTIDGQDVTQITIDGQDVLSTIPDSGVSRWTFDNADTSGSTSVDVWGNNDGTINGATTGASGANQTYTTNEAYDFDGIDDYINVPTDTSLHPNDVSIACWLNPTSSSDFEFALSNSEYEILKTNTDNIRWQLGRNVYQLDSTSTFTDWVHVVGTFNSSEAILYINGSQDNSASSGDVTTSSSDLIIGDRNDLSSQNFDGTIDDIRVYNKALSGAEVSNLYNTGNITGE